MYTIKFTKRAVKELNRLGKKVKDKILASLEILAVDPFAEIINSKKLRGRQNLFRIRIGDYRVIYEIYGSELVIIVVRVGHRKDVYQYLRGT